MSARLSSWQLPDQIADVLPFEARHIEELRRLWLDTARSYGYELVIPPLLEHLESLLTGAGEALELQTFKLVDQLSGRTLGLRADTTPQTARIDSHLLNRTGVTRLCYCGPVLHTRVERPHATREPLQFGAEIYGHKGLEADLETQMLALDGLRAMGVQNLLVDMADVRIVRSLLTGLVMSPEMQARIHAALAAKDASELQALARHLGNALSSDARNGLMTLLQLYGDSTVLIEAQKSLPAMPGLHEALSNLQWLASHGGAEDVRFCFDLADLRGYAYYSGPRFAIYGNSAELVRGGRYDEVGAVFGRNRPAAGFSLDLKELARVLPAPALKAAILAPWGEDAALRQAIADLRAAGETVACAMPGHAHEVHAFECDRELVERHGKWQTQSLQSQIS